MKHFKKKYGVVGFLVFALFVIGCEAQDNEERIGAIQAQMFAITAVNAAGELMPCDDKRAPRSCRGDESGFIRTPYGDVYVTTPEGAMAIAHALNRKGYDVNGYNPRGKDPLEGLDAKKLSRDTQDLLDKYFDPA